MSSGYSCDRTVFNSLRQYKYDVPQCRADNWTSWCVLNFWDWILVHAKCRIDTQENGTCATLIPLFKARIEDLKTADYQTRFLSAPSLKLTDILHTPQERKMFKKNLTFTILRILIKNGGDRFKKFEKKT